jgi:hypothetical protein
MANVIEYSTSLLPNDYVVTTSRYINSQVLFYGSQKKITFNIYQRRTIPVSADDRYVYINAGYEYRPDLVSYKAYGIPDYWWLILQANNINDVFYFKNGITVRIPSILNPSN